MSNEGSLLGGIAGFAAIATLAWLLAPSVSDKDVQKAEACQNEAVERNLGVVYDKEKKHWYYSRNKIKQLEYYQFMSACLPDGYPQKAKVEKRVIRVRKKLGMD